MSLRKFLKDNSLLHISNYYYVKNLGGEGSSLTALYQNKSKEKVVFKFLIAPKTTVELERFKLEASVLERNLINSNPHGDPSEVSKFHGPAESYPLPEIIYPYHTKHSHMINYFAYKYEDGQLLSEINTESLNFLDKIKLLHRIASGLNYFTFTGYEHRDLHPGNILLKNDPEIPYDADETNNPKVKFLDLGNCQLSMLNKSAYMIFDRNLNEELVFQDNNKRLLSSFHSMPPDFLRQGQNTKNYDSWAFGVFAYHMFFQEMPFKLQTIDDVNNLLSKKLNMDSFDANLQTLKIGIRIILKHLLDVDGEYRPNMHSIVNLLSWFKNEEVNYRCNSEEFMKRLIKSGGFDPDVDPNDFYN